MQTFNLTQAAKLTKSSRGRLYRAIEDGRLVCAKGGGPGKETRVTLDALRAAGFRVPEAIDLKSLNQSQEGLDRTSPETSQSASPEMAQAIDLLVDRLSERLAEHLKYFAEWVEHSMEHSNERLMERIEERLVERLMERLASAQPKDPILERLTGRLGIDIPVEEDPEHGPPLRDIPTKAQFRRQVKAEQAQVRAEHDQRKLKLVERIQQWHREGLSDGQIAERLNAEGEPTLKPGGRWYRGTIWNLRDELKMEKVRLG
jgi:hypothetical protein